MNILSLLKKKYKEEIEQREEAIRQRRQLNMTVDERLINEIKKLAAQFTIPRYCLVEHLLETGCYYLTRAMESEDRTKILRQHLIHVHLIDNGIDDSEAILRIGEGGDVSNLLTQIRPFLRSFRAFRHVALRAKKTGNLPDITYYDRCERNFLKSAIGFAIWLETNRPDELSNNNADEQEVESDLSD
jgi:hypothetical protein